MIILEAMSSKDIIKIFPNLNIEKILEYIERNIQFLRNQHEELKNVEMKWPLLVKVFSLMKGNIFFYNNEFDNHEETNYENFNRINAFYNIIHTLLYMSLLLQNKNLMNNLDPDEKEYIQKFNTLKSYDDMLNWFQNFPKEKVYSIILKKYYGDIKYEPIYKNEEYAIYHLTNYVMSRKIGGDTHWCVSSPTSGKESFQTYTEDGYSLYALVFYKDKDPQRKYLLAIDKQKENKHPFWKYIEYIGKGEELVKYFWNQVKKEIPVIGKPEGEEALKHVLKIVRSSPYNLYTDSSFVLKAIEDNSMMFLQLSKASNVSEFEKIMEKYMIKITNDSYKLAFPNISSPLELWKYLNDMNFHNHIMLIKNRFNPKAIINNIVESVRADFERKFFPLENVNFDIDEIISYEYEFKDRNDQNIKDVNQKLNLLHLYTKALPDVENLVKELQLYLDHYQDVYDTYNYLIAKIVDDEDGIKEDLEKKYNEYLRYLRLLSPIFLIEELALRYPPEGQYEKFLMHAFFNYYSYELKYQLINVIKNALQPLRNVLDEEKVKHLDEMIEKAMNKANGPYLFTKSGPRSFLTDISIALRNVFPESKIR